MKQFIDEVSKSNEKTTKKEKVQDVLIIEKDNCNKRPNVFTKLMKKLEKVNV